MDNLILVDSIIKYLQKDFQHQNVHVKAFPGYNRVRVILDIGDMIECTYCKEWYHDCCIKIPKKYFTNEALDYICSKVCQIMSDKSISLSY